MESVSLPSESPSPQSSPPDSPHMESAPLIMSQPGGLSSPAPSLPPRQSRPRRVDPRLPPPNPDGKCCRTQLHGTDRQLRVNVDPLLESSGPHSAGDEPDTSAQSQPRKRKRVEGGIIWSQVEYTVTLGVRPRDFVIQLANYCREVDIPQVIRDVTSPHLSPISTGTLISLATEHAHHTLNNNVTKFWQTVIEIQIALRCERFVWYLSGSFWHVSDDYKKYRGKRQGYMGFKACWFWCGGHGQKSFRVSPWTGKKVVSIGCWRYVDQFALARTRLRLTCSQLPCMFFR